jgi:hypothetical protein
LPGLALLMLPPMSEKFELKTHELLMMEGFGTLRISPDDKATR